ncbi:Peptide-binding protein OS=Streptomyces alboniger OX=132473 GN=CP975_04800 PE=3 SV=1 [Streptomyces alboniger]
MAQLVDRAAIAHKVYKDTVDPLYSMVPKGLTGHTTGFFDDFGNPSTSKARQILSEAGITERVPLTLWYTTDRYGSETALQFQELKRQLDDSGLFTITLKSRPWKTYVEKRLLTGRASTRCSGAAGSPTSRTRTTSSPQLRGEGERVALGTPYPAAKITGVLLPRSRGESNRANGEEDFEEAQQILVDDARLLPLWQGRQYVAASEDISGAERALDPSTIMTVWQLYRKTSW